MQHHPLPTALAVLCNGAPEDAQSRRLWPRWAALLPHVLSAVSVVDDNTDPDIAADASWLLDRAGTYLQTQGRARQARPLLESALTLSETAYGPDHPDVGTALNNLAWILCGLGDLAAARLLAQRALTIAEAAYGRDHPNVGIALNGLAFILRNLGDLAAARPLAERALTTSESAYGPEHPQVDSIREELAEIIRTLEAEDK
jgi:tetratricopeptide (TPR) repeat protein